MTHVTAVKITGVISLPAGAAVILDEFQAIDTIGTSNKYLVFSGR
jgi:hypothetical protein